MRINYYDRTSDFPKKGKKCYRDTDGDGIPDEEW